MSERVICCVYTQPVPGHESEYNDWYDHRHLHDVARVPGVLSAQRFEMVGAEAALGGPLTRFLAIYEIEGDPSGFVGELRSRFGTVEMPASDALDLQSLTMTFWKARAEPIVSL